MLLAFVIYTFVLLVSTGFSYLWIHIKNSAKISFVYKPLILILPILIVSVLLGYRYNVGTDWNNYQATYLNIINNGISFYDILHSDYEPIYLTLNAIIAFFGSPYQIFFTVIIVLYLYLLYKSFSKFSFLLPLGFFFFITTTLFNALNIQRQVLSVCIFLYSTKYILSRDIFKYFFCVTIATLCHTSSIILFPLYFITNPLFKFIDKTFVLLLLYFISFFLYDIIFDILIDLLSVFFSDNARYLRNIESIGRLAMETTTGLGVLSTKIIDVILIFYSSKLSKVYKDYKFNTLFRIFFIGVFLSNIFQLDVFLSRVPLAMESTRIFILAFLINYLLKIRKNVINYIIAISLLVLHLAIYYVGIINGAGGCSPYQFA